MMYIVVVLCAISVVCDVDSSFDVRESPIRTPWALASDVQYVLWMW